MATAKKKKLVLIKNAEKNAPNSIPAPPPKTKPKDVPPAPAAPPNNAVQMANQPKNKVIEGLIKYMGEYEKQILPDLLVEHKLSVNTFRQCVINEVKRNDKMMEAYLSNPMSLFGAILFFAEIGLVPSGNIGDAFLTAYWSTKLNKHVVVPIIGYQGVITLLTRSEKVKKIEAECVYDGEIFDYELGLNPFLKHKPNLDILRNSATLKYVYSTSTLGNGERQFKVMSKSEIMAVRDMSKVTNELYFNDIKDPNQWMAKKTVIKQLAKTLPKDYYGKKALLTESQAEGGQFIIIADTATKEGYSLVKSPPGAPKKLTNMYQTLGAIETIPEILNNSMADDALPEVPVIAKVKRATKKVKA